MNIRARWPILANSSGAFTVQSRSPGVNCGEFAMADFVQLGNIGRLAHLTVLGRGGKGNDGCVAKSIP